jgi:hypothetical protein
MKSVAMSSVDELFGPVATAPDGSGILAALQAAARRRILILDGAMGTQIQGLGSTRIISVATNLSAAPVTSKATTTC